MSCKMEKTKNILIDCSFIEESWSASNSLIIYTVRLIQGFLEFGSTQICVLIWKDKEELIDNLIGRKYDKIVIDRNDLVCRWRPYYRLTGLLPNQIRKGIVERDISNVLLPHIYGVLFFYPRKIRHYAVVHDLIIFDRLKEKRGKMYLTMVHVYLKYLLGKFTGIIAISKNTQKELLQKEGFESEIVHNSIPFDFSVAEQPIQKILGKKYILDINRYELYKNAETLIRAFNLLRDTIPHILYLKGGEHHTESRIVLENLVTELGLNDRVIFDVEVRSEGEMRYLYTHADLFVSPSLQEGFGWTPIEAAVLKVPVLVSNIEVLKEVTCNKIPTFDPHSPEELANKILAILQNPPSEQERTELSDFYLEKYSLSYQIKRLEEIMGL